MSKLHTDGILSNRWLFYTSFSVLKPFGDVKTRSFLASVKQQPVWRSTAADVEQNVTIQRWASCVSCDEWCPYAGRHCSQICCRPAYSNVQLCSRVLLRRCTLSLLSLLAHPLNNDTNILDQHLYTGCGNKSSPLKFFAVFSATTRNFNWKFYSFICWDILHMTAKWNVILLKNGEVIDFNVTTYRFSSDKNVKAENATYLKNGY